VINCVIHDNGENVENVDVDDYCAFHNCVIDGTNQTGETGLMISDGNKVTGCRITNCATGIDSIARINMYGWNVFNGNTANTANATYLYAIPYDADSDTNEDNPDAGDDGYENVANDDFNIKTSMTYNGDGTDTVGLNIGS